MLTEPITAETLTYSPTRTDPMTIYQEVILPDLRFASEWLPTGTHATTTTPTKKAALGFLAKSLLTDVRIWKHRIFAGSLWIQPKIDYRLRNWRWEIQYVYVPIL